MNICPRIRTLGVYITIDHKHTQFSPDEFDMRAD